MMGIKYFNLEMFLRITKVVKEYFYLQPPHTKHEKIIRLCHLSVIAFLLVLITFLYYLDQTPLAQLPALQGSILLGVHDFQRTLFLIPMVYSAIVFKRIGSSVSAVIFLTVILPRAFFYSPFPDPIIRPLIFWLISTLVSFIVAFYSERTDKVKKQTRLDQYLIELMSSQEKEKRSLARELHDGSLQTLVDISHKIDDLNETPTLPDTNVVYQQLRKQVDNTIKNIREFIMGLRPPLIEETGFEASLKWFLQLWSEETGIEASVGSQDILRKLDPDVELHIYRIIQEALQNVKKHSHATRVLVNISNIEKCVEIKIIDNGEGFNIPTWDSLVLGRKFGLAGMTERARLIGGSCHISSIIGTGTTVTVIVPNF